MIKALMVTKNINFVKKLLEEIENYKLDIKIIGVVTNRNDAPNILKPLKFDIIFLDKSMEYLYNTRIFRRI